MQSIWEYMLIILIIGFQTVAYSCILNLHKEVLFIYLYRFIFNPMSIAQLHGINNAWSMAEMQWRYIHYIFIYYSYHTGSKNCMVMVGFNDFIFLNEFKRLIEKMH